MRWVVRPELNAREKKIAGRLRASGKFYLFLRTYARELFDDAFQEELAKAGYKTARGEAPIPPALLAMVTLLQAYTGTSDARAVESAEMDARWQLVLGTLGSDDAPFSQGSLVRFRERMIEHDLDKKLLDRTVSLAKSTRGFGWQALRAAFDSSPLIGAGRVEDTWNLVGRAMRHLVAAVAKVLGRTLDQVCRDANVTLLGASSLKAALDIDWDDAEAKNEGFRKLLAEAEALRAWVVEHSGERAKAPPLDAVLKQLATVIAQDTEPDPDTPVPGTRRMHRGTRPGRMPSLGDPEMRHGRKNATKTFNGYKRHVASLSGKRFVLEALVRPANEPEQEALEPLLAGIVGHGPLEAVMFDRGYLGSPEVIRLRQEGVSLIAKPWPTQGLKGKFSKDDFVIELAQGVVTCPAGVESIIDDQLLARFGTACGTCQLRAKCTDAKNGRTLRIHEHEDLLLELRSQLKESARRHQLRERTHVEHTLASIGAHQGHRARYRGTRKNTLDLRRHSTVTNLLTLQRVRHAA